MIIDWFFNVFFWIKGIIFPIVLCYDNMTFTLNMRFIMKNLFLSTLSLSIMLSLTACGSDSDNNTNTSNTNVTPPATTPTTPTQPTQPVKPQPNNPTTPTAQAGNYRLDPAQKTQEKILQQLNDLAKQGYAFVNPTTEGNLSYQTNNAKNIEYIADKKTLTIKTLNEFGKNGYLYKMPTYDSAYQLFNLYFKNKSTKKTYEYQAIKSTENFLNKSNEFGKNGWRYHSMLMLDSSQHYLYMKETGNTNYEYRVETDHGTLTKFREQINQQAKEGFVYRGGLALSTTKLVNLFERTANQKSISCEVVESPTKVDLTLMNKYAKQGHISLGKLIIGKQSVEVFCKGISNVWQPLTGPMLP